LQLNPSFGFSGEIEEEVGRKMSLSFFFSPFSFFSKTSPAFSHADKPFFFSLTVTKLYPTFPFAKVVYISPFFIFVTVVFSSSLFSFIEMARFLSRENSLSTFFFF